MSSILKPTLGIGLGAGFAIASIWWVDHWAPVRKAENSPFSVAALANDPDMLLLPITHQQPILAEFNQESDLLAGNPTPTDARLETIATDNREFDLRLDNETSDSELTQVRLDNNEETAESAESLSMAIRSPNLLADSPIQADSAHQGFPDRTENKPTANIARVSKGRPSTPVGVQVNPFFEATKNLPSVPSMQTAAQNATDAVAHQPQHAPANQQAIEKPELDTDFLAVSADSVRLQTERVLETQLQFATAPPLGPQNSEPSLRLTEAVAVRAVQHIEYGKTLARRGAKASAKQEFIAALSVIAQDFDSQAAGVEFSQALRRGMTALKESEEFVLGDSESQIGMDVAALVESHQSGALSKVEAAGLTPVQALQRYYGFAQLQIQHAVGKNVVSAEALFCLGRLYTLAEAGELLDGKLDRAKAMVYHRASLCCDPTNYRSANELGVLLAEFGELDDALNLLKHSLRIRRTPRTWENVAKLHTRLNQPELAEAARIEHERLLANQNSGMIEWVDSHQFNGTLAEGRLAANPEFSAAPKVTDAAQGSRLASEPEKASFSERLKSWF